MVAGAALAGAGLVVANVAVSLTLPLTGMLRLGWVTAAEAARQAAIMVVIIALVVAGAGLAPFFAAHIAGGVAALAVTLVALRGSFGARPRFAWTHWRPLIAITLPVAAALILNVAYLRVLLVMTSLLTGATETGLAGTSFRILEMFLGIPLLMVGAAFPILAYAGAGDEEARLAYGLQRLAEASLLVAVVLVLGLAIAAEPVVVVLGGEEYRESAPVLRLQALVLLPAFLTQVWAFGLVAIERQKALIAVSGTGLVTVLVLGGILIPAMEAEGAALAAVIGETILAATALALLVRGRPALRPKPDRLARTVLAGVLALAVLLVPGLPAVVAAVLAIVIFAGLAWVLGAVPRELVDALLRRDASYASTP
jgi:O-antigen/teichoic acid export membrane protein